MLGIVAVATFSTMAWAQESMWKDQEEFNLGTAAGKENDPQKKLDKLKEWEQKYPDSKLKDQRTLLQAQALLGIALAAYGKPGPPELLDAGQKAAQQIVDNMNTYFADSVKPAQATAQQWTDVKKDFELKSHSVLGWIAMAKKNDTAAETEFKKVLALDPNAAQVSYYLGTVIIRQKNVARYSEALYDIARALSVTGAEALPADAQKQYGDYLKRAYSGYHGSEEGLDQLKATVSGAALPPENFHIESIEEIEKKKFANAEEFNKAHPDVALWRQIRDTLKSDTGDTYFTNIKGSLVPPTDIGTFKGKVVTVNDKDLIVNVDNAGGDVTLKFEKAINSKVINVGDALEFKGEVESFTKEPYMLTVTVDDPKEQIKGLPANAFSAAPPTRKAPVRKALPKKK
jgi:tetratricopeptide (TPR) repeat protein